MMVMSVFQRSLRFLISLRTVSSPCRELYRFSSRCQWFPLNFLWKRELQVRGDDFFFLNMPHVSSIWHSVSYGHEHPYLMSSSYISFCLNFLRQDVTPQSIVKYSHAECLFEEFFFFMFLMLADNWRIRTSECVFAHWPLGKGLHSTWLCQVSVGTPNESWTHLPGLKSPCPDR